jgi:signal transduction histidine kinase
MQWRLFAWLALAIVLAGAAAVGVFWTFGDSGRTWSRRVEGAKALVAHVEGRAWDDPAERRDLVAAIERDAELRVRLLDTRGDVIEDAGFPAACGHVERVDVPPHGRVELCLDGHRPGAGHALFFGALAAVVVVLWLFAGFLAHRLARPLAELTRVARELGEGNLGSRARLRHGTRGEVGELAHVLEEMAVRIEKQLGDQRALLGAVSHELRTPLTRLRVLVEMAREAGGPSDAQLAEMEREVVEMDALVGDLLAASRIDFAAIAPDTLDARALAEEALRRAAIEGASLVVEGDAGTVRVDPTLGARAVLALLENARRHGGPTVVLRVRDLGPRVAFEVEDDGDGLAPGDEERVFAPFYRGPSAGDGGVGLGLALVRRIAEAHGGRAFAARREPTGARFTIELPRREAA